MAHMAFSSALCAARSPWNGFVPQMGCFHLSGRFATGFPSSLFSVRRSSSENSGGFGSRRLRTGGFVSASAATEKSIHDFTVKVGTFSLACM